ncbi:MULTISPECIES: ParA family protein [unclassified Leucobacter]|uniref:ParA family protein n=1 Tax=unclassified Leucobacter TaxID=2621730 RepID=UPI00301B5DAD
MNRDLLDRVVAFINGKGGVGKTTMVANIGGLMARSNARVLLIDMDPQGNLGLDLGYADDEQRDDKGRSLSSVLQDLVPQVKILKDVRENLDVIVGGRALHGAAAALAAPSRGMEPHDALARALVEVADDYELILIDCPPGNESLQTAAIGAARWVIAPSRADEGTGRGLEELAERLESVVTVNPNIDLLGVALFDIEKQATRVEEKARKMVSDYIGSEDVLFNASIRHSVSVSQQTREYGKLVHELDEFAKKQPEWWKIRRGDASADQQVTRSAANVADDFHALTTEIMQRLSAHEQRLAAQMEAAQ